MVNTEIRLIIFFAAKDGEALSVQFSRSVMSNSLRPHESQHPRPPCPSPTAGVHSDSCPSSQWCHPAISSSVAFSSCPQSLPASRSFPMSQLFGSGDQSIGGSASASVLPMNIQTWSHLGWTGWISLQCNGLKSFLQPHSSKASILRCSAFFAVQLSCPYKMTSQVDSNSTKVWISTSSKSSCDTSGWDLKESFYHGWETHSQKNVRWMSSSAFRRVRLVTCFTWWHFNKYKKEKIVLFEEHRIHLKEGSVSGKISWKAFGRGL